jgi:hypothetical protein
VTHPRLGQCSGMSPEGNDSGMNTEAERERFKKHAPELNLLLWALWNPIGASVPLDESESYVPRIWKLLVVDASVEDIAAELRRIEQDRMDSTGNGTQAVAERLKDWWYWRFKYPDELRR